MTQRQSRFDVYLTGFMGAGKSTAGQLLAKRLGWEFVDLDEAIERREGRSIASIFTTQGEGAFRQIEARMLDELLTSQRSSEVNRVVALGGGTLASERNRQRLATSSGRLVFLNATTETLLRRCRQHSEERLRPLAVDAAQFAKLHKERQIAYNKAAIHIDTDNRSIEEVVLEIEQQLGFAVNAKERHGA